MMGDVYEAQVASLWEAVFTSLREKLNKLCIGPGLPRLMNDATRVSFTGCARAVKRLQVPQATSYGSGMSNVNQISSLRGRLAEHNTK